MVVRQGRCVVSEVVGRSDFFPDYFGQKHWDSDLEQAADDAQGTVGHLGHTEWAESDE